MNGVEASGTVTGSGCLSVCCPTSAPGLLAASGSVSSDATSVGTVACAVASINEAVPLPSRSQANPWEIPDIICVPI